MNEYGNSGLSSEELIHLFKLIKLKKGIDLTDYAIASLNRRIKRFIDIYKFKSFEDLTDRINKEEGFADVFINEITVNVTEMFRDPSFWNTLRESVFNELGKKSSITIWHAGCSMGEEVYSMTIMLNELNLLKKTSIIASDINSEALEIAKKGVYPLKNQSLNRANYSASKGKKDLMDYYKLKDNVVEYNPELISSTEFVKHDLTTDSGCGLFDLIICRNVFIYFNLNLQEKVLGTFTQSLKPLGFLGIGSKESISWLKGVRHYDIISLENKIFRKTENTNDKNL